MSDFPITGSLTGKIHLLQPDDNEWHEKVNDNFKLMSTYRVHEFSDTDTSVTIDDSTELPTGAVLDRFLIVDTASVTGTTPCTVVLPDPTANYGRVLSIIRRDNTQRIDLSPTSDVVGETQIAKTTGLRMDLTCNGVDWYGISQDG